MLGLLCGLQQQSKLSFSFKFAIFASSFKSRSLPHHPLYSERITLPTLHIYGETDQVRKWFYAHSTYEYLCTIVSITLVVVITILMACGKFTSSAGIS